MRQLSLFIAGLLGLSTAYVVEQRREATAKFGEVKIFHHDDGQPPEAMVFVLYDDASFQKSAHALGEEIGREGSVAVAIDLNAYATSLGPVRFCSAVTQDLDDLSKSLQRRLDFKAPVPLFLVGRGLGAHAVATASARSRGETFAGFVSLGENGRTPACANIDPARVTAAASPPDHPDAAMAGPEADVIKAHQSLRVKAWAASVKDQIYALLNLPEGDERDWDRATKNFAPAQAKGDRLVVLYSGDGGWATFVQKLTAKFTAAGTPVVGVNSLKYFWNQKTPDAAAVDLDRLLARAFETFGPRRVQLVGFSYGADVLPFLVARLPGARRRQIARVSLLSVGKLAEFEFHLKNWFSDEQTGLEILPELARTPRPVDCVYGVEEADDSLCATVRLPGIAVHRHSGGHFLDWDVDGVYRIITE